MLSILFALTGFLVILAVVGVCLGILYRRRIRRRIREEQEALASGGQPPESRRHTRTSPETAGAAVVILSLTAGVLAVILLFLSIAVSEINASVENARLSLSNQLLEAEKQQNSLLGDIRFGPERVYGQNAREPGLTTEQLADTQTTVVLYLQNCDLGLNGDAETDGCIPEAVITVGERDFGSICLRFYVSGYENCCTVSNHSLSHDDFRDTEDPYAKLRRALFEAPDPACPVTLTLISADGVITSETLDADRFPALSCLFRPKWPYYLPSDGTVVRTDGKGIRWAWGGVKYDMTADIRIYLPDCSLETVTDCAVRVYVDGKPAAEHPVEGLTETNGCLTADGFTVSGSLEAERRAKVEMYLEFTDTSGFLHRRLLAARSADPQPEVAPESVFAPDGTLLTE